MTCLFRPPLFFGQLVREIPRVAEAVNFNRAIRGVVTVDFYNLSFVGQSGVLLSKIVRLRISC